MRWNGKKQKSFVYFQGKKVQESKDEDRYVLSWRSRRKIMHSFIKINNNKFQINVAKFSTFPALIECYKRKPENDEFHLAEGLPNPRINTFVKNRNSRRDSPESLSWYHGTVGHEVQFFEIFI